MSDFQAELIASLRPLRAFAQTLVNDHARAEDLVQETMLKAWRNRGQFRPGTKMRSWLFTILRNSFYSDLRKRKREVEDPDDVHAQRLAVPGGQDSNLEFKALRAALAQLKDDQREALILVGASGFSYDEAAEICGVAPGTIKSRVSRARYRLADLMGDRKVAPRAPAGPGDRSAAPRSAPAAPARSSAG